MKFLDRLEKHLGFLAVPNVALTLVFAQLFIYAAIIIGRVDYGSIVLIPKAVLSGEYWRMVSFLIAPPYVPGTLFQGLFLAFFWYIFWMMSNTLEVAWGVFRFNLFLLTCILLAVVGAFLGQFISPSALIYVAPKFLFYSVFFAFATINPNIQFLIMFIIPMKVKWLAWITAVVGGLVFLSLPSMGQKLAFIAPYIAYLLFFKSAFKQSVVSSQRRAKFAATKRELDAEALHTCAQCGATDKTHPDADFRYKIVDGDAICSCGDCRERP